MQKLTAAQQKSLDALIAAGGVVGDYLDAYKAAGIDGRAVPALVRKGLVRYCQSGERAQWTIELVRN